MEAYDFDRITDRRNTFSYKWDIKEGELPMWVADMDFETLCQGSFDPAGRAWYLWLFRCSAGVEPGNLRLVAEKTSFSNAGGLADLLCRRDPCDRCGGQTHDKCRR